ncbi:hypothetical protein LB505_014141 [Fusarium chuoi]|nr:hypothetical protein LB505_014141 [Fusarium chuoi]
MVLHDWPDEYAANILRHLVPHLSVERNLQDWTSLLAKADERLTLTYVSEALGSVHQFLEVGHCR